MTAKIIINDGVQCGNLVGNRVITFTSDGEYDEDVVKEGVERLIRFLHRHVSSGFVKMLEMKLKETW